MGKIVKMVAMGLLGAVIGGIIVVAVVSSLPRECKSFVVYVPNEWGAVAVGDISLCGRGLEWGMITGPTTSKGML